MIKIFFTLMFISFFNVSFAYIRYTSEEGTAFDPNDNSIISSWRYRVVHDDLNETDTLKFFATEDLPDFSIVCDGNDQKIKAYIFTEDSIGYKGDNVTFDYRIGKHKGLNFVAKNEGINSYRKSVINNSLQLDFVDVKYTSYKVIDTFNFLNSLLDGDEFVFRGRGSTKTNKIFLTPFKYSNGTRVKAPKEVIRKHGKKVTFDDEVSLTNCKSLSDGKINCFYKRGLFNDYAIEWSATYNFYDGANEVDRILKAFEKLTSCHF